MMFESAIPFDTSGLMLYGDSFAPTQVQPAATNWSDVLKFGISRLADYKIATVQPQNPQIQIAPSQRPQAGPTTTGGAGSVAGFDLGRWMPWIIVGGVALLVLRGR